ncbi:signal peptidase I [Clostridium perfringens]|uniref:signal peptidase I n=1 Tax=Clostridium perfringens TaxID=1502 RepID=UPI000DA3B2D4|nr:signal peptidase I [Clostridium perfringens]SQI02726.1 type I signal peptidase [Clostridium perfringens]
MSKNLKEYVVIIFTAIVLTLLINKFLLFKIVVPTPSMAPTIEPGDQLFAIRIHNLSKMERGDMIVFYSKEFDERMIKRLIGLPGDKVEIKEDGTVNVNNEKLDEPYIKYLGGKVNMNFEVPEDKYLLLGDNRDNSKDARYWSDKYIDGDDILGKAQITVWPLNRFNFAN